MRRDRELEEALTALGLLRGSVDDEDVSRSDPPLLALCDAGRLVGGLSLARGVRAEEAFGPLCRELGGGARALKLVDVLDRPGPALVIERSGRSETWPTPDVSALLATLARTFAEDSETARVVLLGETEAGALQVWSLPRAAYERVRRLPGFRELPLERPEAPPPQEEAPEGPRAPVARHALRLTIEAPERLRTEVDVPSTTERFELGRSPGADLRLDVEGVSRVHALLVRRGGWRLRAGPGAEALRLNGEALPPAGAMLASGDVIEFGPVRLRVTVGKTETKNGDRLL